jgi:hypothetical protein
MALCSLRVIGLRARAASIARKRSEEKGFSLEASIAGLRSEKVSEKWGAGKRSDRAHALGDGGRVAEADNRPQR